MRLVGFVVFCIASAHAMAGGQTVTLGWAEERITLAGETQRVSMPILNGTHGWNLVPSTELRLVWSGAPNQPSSANLEQLIDNMDFNLVELNVQGRVDAWSWQAGLKPAFLGDPDTQPLTIYAADFDQDKTVTEQLFLGAGWEVDPFKLDAAIFRLSSMQHTHIGRRSPGVVRMSGLTATPGFESWSLAIQGRVQRPYHWRLEYAHLATNKEGEQDSTLWMTSFSGPMKIFEGHRWDLDLVNHQHFRGTQEHAKEWMLSWSAPLATGTLQLTYANRIASSAHELKLTELAYAVSPVKNLNLILGVSTTQSAPGRSVALGILVDYMLYKSP